VISVHILNSLASVVARRFPVLPCPRHKTREKGSPSRLADLLAVSPSFLAIDHYFSELKF
jgi:hypothetical protein